MEEALARSVPLDKLAKRYGVSRDALFRHRKKMRREQPEIFRALVAAEWKVTPAQLEELRTESSDGYLRVLRSQVATLIAAQNRALEDGADGAAAAFAGQVHKAMDLVGRAVRQIGGATVNVHQNILIMPEFHAVRGAIIRALAPYPDARAAVLRAMQEGAEAAERGEELPQHLELTASPVEEIAR